MAVTLGNIWESNLEPTGEGLGLGLGFVRYRRSMSGKRIAISSNMEVDSTPTLKKPCLDRTPAAPNKSLLEALPQDILIRILCGVDHDDLKQLYSVSKPIREAALIAKQCHFAYSTPTKKRLPFRNSTNLGDEDILEEVEAEAPGAPKQSWPHRARTRLSAKKLAGISVALFASPIEEL